jgi:hypothetical protein
LRVILINAKALRETTMVLRTTGAGLLVMLMTRSSWTRSQADTAWLLYGPTDPDAVEAPAEDDDSPPLLLAAE